MKQRDRNYLLLQCCVGSAILNAAINGGIGWAATRGRVAMPLWGVPGVAGDLAGTAFGIAFGTCIGMVLQVKRDLAHGKIGPVELSPGLSAVIGRFPAGTFARSVALGAASIPLFALPAIAVLALLGAAEVTRIPFIELKTLFAAIVGGVVAPPLALAALRSVGAKTQPVTA